MVSSTRVFFKQVALLQGYTQNDIDVWWGVYTGKYKLLINVPISIASAMAASFVPVLTGAYHRGRYGGSERTD